MCLRPKKDQSDNQDKSDKTDRQKRPGSTVRLSARAQAHQNHMIEQGYFPSGNAMQNFLTELHADCYEAGCPARVTLEGPLEQRLEIMRDFIDIALRRLKEQAAGIHRLLGA